MTKKILIILITLAVMFTVSAYKKQTHKVEQLNGTITTIEQQKQSTETELQKTKETDSQNQQKIKELEEKIKQLEADLQAREARKQLVANDPCRLVYDYTEWDARVMYAICKAESGGNPSIIGDTNITYYQDGELYGMSTGLFQIRYLPGRDAHPDKMKDPEANVRMAYSIFKSQGLQAWSVYTNGRYLDYI